MLRLSQAKRYFKVAANNNGSSGDGDGGNGSLVASTTCLVLSCACVPACVRAFHFVHVLPATNYKAQ